MREFPLLRDDLDLRLLDVGVFEPRRRHARAIGLRLIAASGLIEVGEARAHRLDVERARLAEDVARRERRLVGARDPRQQDREQQRSAGDH